MKPAGIRWWARPAYRGHGRALENGARKAAIHDDMHRVERTGLILDIPLRSLLKKR